MFGKQRFKFSRGCGEGFRSEFMRMRRGDIKFHLLEILKDAPRHGYEIISELETRSGGYRPSPGSVYPTLQMLEEGGYLTGEQVEGKKVYTITDKGRKLLKERGGMPFEAHPKMARAFEIRKSLMKLGGAAMDGVRDGDEETVKRIAEIINKARRDVYSILAES
ncbi:MAG: PadR family transcriptional regulator [Acidobacteria bacterium]|nr:PadR family transcriptional regulator [Acidobacteriota bacterium]MCA1640306.1 PadR family transcriptional regulator [Acidobacteriota bacterium]